MYLLDINERLKDRGLILELTRDAKNFLADKGFTKVSGARPLRRAVERHLEDPLAEEMLKGDVVDNQLVKVEVRKGKLAFSSKPNPQPQASPETAESKE